MQERGGHVEIETPEHVVFHYELAGVMSRLIAGAFDFMLQVLIALGIILAFGIVIGGSSEFRDFSRTGIGILALFLFLDMWGYSVLFETFMRGRTPGKMWAKLRVIREGGYALTAGDVMVRNLLRIADFMPMFYGLGIIVMCSNARCKRIGDYVAGTIVIRDGAAESGPLIRNLLAAMPPPSPESVEALRRAGVHRISGEQITLIESFLQRRATLNPEARYTLARQIAEPIAGRLGLPVGAPEKFMIDALFAYRQATKERA